MNTGDVLIIEVMANFETEESSIFETEDVEEIEEEKEDFQLDDALGPPKGGVLIRFDGNVLALPNREELAKAAFEPMIHGEVAYFLPTYVEETNLYVKGSPVYAIRLFGSMPDGTKAEVIITDIEVYFDIRVLIPEGALKSLILTMLATTGVSASGMKSFTAIPPRGVYETPQPYLRIFFDNLQDRKKALSLVRTMGYETASDDMSSYYRSVARNNELPLTTWAELRDFTYTAGPTQYSPMCSHVYKVSISGYKASEKSFKDTRVTLTLDIETHTSRGTVPSPEHDEDNIFMLCMTVHFGDENEARQKICLVDVETAPDPNWITVICKTEANILKAFALCWHMIAPDIQLDFNGSNYDWPFIVTKAEKHGLLGWMFEKMSATYRKNIDTASVLKWGYKTNKRIKISAEETFLSSYLEVPGCVPIDVRVVFKKLYPKAATTKQGSLKFYLELSNLAGKADMPHTLMWRYYRAAKGISNGVNGVNGVINNGVNNNDAAEKMRHVSHYCCIDALRCQQLMVKRGVINDYCNTSAMAFVSLNDSHYYANGMKVCNLLGAYANKRGMLITLISQKVEMSGKFPGAYVFPPEKGLIPDPIKLNHIDDIRDKVISGEMDPSDESVSAAFEDFAKSRPVTGLDFSSLYPNLIMAYNLSPEKIVVTSEEAELLGRSHNIHVISFPFGGKTIRGWSIRHDNDPNKMGLYPTVLNDLFNKRAKVKKELNVYGEQKEVIEALFARENTGGNGNDTAINAMLTETENEVNTLKNTNETNIKISPGATLEEELADVKRRMKFAEAQIRILRGLIGKNVKEEYVRICYEYAKINSNQNAIKVYMNTFYGEAGNTLSPFFMLELAGGVTSAGQYNLKMVAEFVKSKDFLIKYGDTDSLYLVPPNKYFAECDQLYITGRFNREEWFSAMVRITMRALNQIRDEVNAYLESDNGTKKLSMAYEEVTFPMYLAAKKKYWAYAHINAVNFRPKKLFIRGIDVIKQGVSGLAKEIGYRIMWEMCSIYNKKTPKQIVEDTLADAINNPSQWKYEDFVMTDAWKPDKRNVPVQRFIARMKVKKEIEEKTSQAGKYTIPDPGERFSYVIVKKSGTHDIYGKKTDLKKGDVMEYAHIAKGVYEIDVAFYMIRKVIGICARFISHDYPNLSDVDSAKAAKDYLEVFVKSLEGSNKSTIQKRGYAYKRAYKQAAKEVKSVLVDRIGRDAANVLHGDWINFELFDNEDTGKIIDECWMASKQYADFIVPLIQDEVYETTRDLTTVPATLRRTRHVPLSGYDAAEARVRSKMINLLPDIVGIATKYTIVLEEIVNVWRAQEHKLHPELGEFNCDGATTDIIQFDEGERKTLEEWNRLWDMSCGIMMLRKLSSEYSAYVSQKRDKRLGIVKPDRSTLSKSAEEFAASMTTSDDWD